MKRLVFALPVALACSFGALGCHDDDGGSGYVQSCERNCARLHECLSTVDPQQCTSNCQTRLSSYGDHLRSDYLGYVDMCVENLSCSQLGSAALSDTCPAEAKARIAATPDAIALCEAVSASFQQCVGLSVRTDGCINNVKIFDASTLRAARRCTSSPCDQRVSCLGDALGVSLLGN